MVHVDKHGDVVLVNVQARATCQVSQAYEIMLLANRDAHSYEVSLKGALKRVSDKLEPRIE